MPQLDPAVFLPQIFWLAIIFTLLYLFIAYSAAPKIAEVLERRRSRIESDLEQAEKLQADAEAARLVFEKSQEEARAAAMATVTTERENIKAEFEKSYADLSEKLGAEAAAAEARINDAKTRALDDLKQVAGDICKDVVAKVSGLDVSDADIAKAVNGTMKDAG